MSISIYYFSATGNSLTTARALAQGLEDSKLIPVASTKHLHCVPEQAEAVGFVFPVYFGNMPYIVRELVSKMTFQPNTYIFICTTYRGYTGAVAGKMDDLLRTRGQKLSLNVGIPMPGNSLISTPEKDQEALEKQEANINAILPAIRERKEENYRTEEILPLSPIDSAGNFRGIIADDNCVGCGTCAKLCPMNNIHIVDGKAVIGDNCITCLTCFHWCPTEAVWMSNCEEIARRSKYHHPEVTLEDILAQKK